MCEYTYDEDGLPIPKDEVEKNRMFSSEENVTNIFDMKGQGYDVTLSLAEGSIVWCSVSPKGNKKSKKRGSLFKSSSKSSQWKQSILLDNILGVEMKRRRSAEQQEGKGRCQGFVLTHYTHVDPNCMKAETTVFEHPSEELCGRFIQKITKYIDETTNRPKTVKLFLQPMAGWKIGKTVIKTKVMPLFQASRISVDICEIQHCETIKQEMVHLNLDDFDCIVCMGGDGTVNKVTTGLLNQAQRDRDVEIKPGFTPVKAPIPLGIIPTGRTNQIAHSVMGTEDVVNATIQIILGYSQQVDVLSVYSDDKIISWSFICQYGFAGNILEHLNRYNIIGARNYEPAFIKALTKAKLRSYECDIEYIPAGSTSSKAYERPCVSGCQICYTENSENGMVTSDEVQELNPLACSGTSSMIVDLTQDNPWRTCKGNYINVGILPISGLCEMAPQGLSKFTHLADGTMDLVMVKNTNRKDFIRFLKRLGNSKDQFDFPFVEVHRVKEVRFRPRLPTGWNYNDHNYNEIDYEMSKVKKRTTSVDILEIDDESPSRVFVSRAKRGTSVGAIEDLTDEDEDSEESDDQDEESPQITSRIQSAPPQRLVGPQYQMSFSDQDRLRRQKKAQKKETKKKQKEERRMNCVWNIDNEICTIKDLDFKVHNGLLRICGRGVAPNYTPPDSSLFCLKILR